CVIQAASPLQVKYADGELERLEHKLFIGMLPKNVADTELTDLFSKYGNIKDLQILRGSQQTSKAGCAFIKYEMKEQAVAAIEDLNGKHKIEVVLVCHWLSNGLIQKRKGRPGKHRKLNCNHLICRMDAQCHNLQYLELYRWDICLSIMDLVISLQGHMDLCSTLYLLCKIKAPFRIWVSLLIKGTRYEESTLNCPPTQVLDHLTQCT
uniref:RRM domain-containing protein n=1 Tax=Aegilops tauschii subsp. strangulata TaxID=200361 RepID=A0A453GKB0_AEGTS